MPQSSAAIGTPAGRGRISIRLRGKDKRGGWKPDPRKGLRVGDSIIFGARVYEDLTAGGSHFEEWDTVADDSAWNGVMAFMGLPAFDAAQDEKNAADGKKRVIPGSFRKATCIACEALTGAGYGFTDEWGSQGA